MVDDPRGPQGEGPRYQPEFAPGERLSRLEALYEAFKRTEIEWQEQIDRRFDDVEKKLNAAAAASDKAVSRAGEAQEKQNTLTREDALRARESIDERVRALERGESAGLGSHRATTQTTTWIIAAISTFAAIAIATAAILHG